MKLKFLQQMFIVSCFGCVLPAESSDEVVSKISANQVQIVAAGKDGSFAYVLMPHDPLKEPLFMAISPDDSKGYVVYQGSISIVNLDSHTPGYLQVAGSVEDVYTNPTSILFSQDGLSAYVVHENSDNVSVIDVATDKVRSGNIELLDSNFFKDIPAGHDVLADVVVNPTDNSITLIGKDSSVS